MIECSAHHFPIGLLLFCSAAEKVCDDEHELTLQNTPRQAHNDTKQTHKHELALCHDVTVDIMTHA